MFTSRFPSWIVLLLVMAMVGCSTSRVRQGGSAMECHLDDCDALIAATQLKVYLEVRSKDHGEVLESIALWSNYMIPEFEVLDVGKRGPMFVVTTRGGGTGFGETHVELFGIVGRHIRQSGDFVVARSAHGEDPNEHDEELVGKVSFPEQDKLVYSYKQTLTKDGKATAKAITEYYSFNTEKGEYKKVEKP